MSNDSTNEISLAGTARLPVVVVAALASFVFASMLEYSLPLYLNSLKELPRNIFARLMWWQILPWIFTPTLAGVLSRRFTERRIWGIALVGQATIPLTLWMFPKPEIIPALAFWNGFTGALMWVGGVSLTQVVPPGRKGLANGLLMMSTGVGSLLGPLVGRALLWRGEIAEMLASGDVQGVGAFLVNLRRPSVDAPLHNFELMLGGLSLLALVTAVIVWFGGQRPGRLKGEDQAHSVEQALADLCRLLANPRFWALTISLCLLGGAVFASTNQFLKYRAEDLDLISRGRDDGWILLQLLKPLVWIPGGLAVGLIAGRRVPAIVAVIMLTIFSLAGLGIGLATTPVALFAIVAVFEFARQFMRWSHAGYLSEHMPSELRSTAIGCSISIAGMGCTLYGALPFDAMDPGAADFRSNTPFFIAAGIGLLGATTLFVFDRFLPIRQRKTDPGLTTKPVTSEMHRLGERAT